MKKFEELFLEVVAFQAEEVVRTSGVSDVEDGVGNDFGNDPFPEL